MPFNIDAIESDLDKLLEDYRLALRAVELLPSYGIVPANEFQASIAALIPKSAKRRSARIKVAVLRYGNRHADLATSRFAIRSVARMFLRSHVRTKLRLFADRLEVERLAYTRLNDVQQKRLDNLIQRLRDYDYRLAPRKSNWLNVFGWIWGIVAPIVITYLSTLVIHPSTHITPGEVLIYIATYLMALAIIVQWPLFIFGVEGGFRWKRLILLGQSGEVNMDISAFIRWTKSPQANAYVSEYHLFQTLGISKPIEFPWDLVLSPLTVLGIPLALAFFIIGIAISIPMKGLSWVELIPFAFVAIGFVILFRVLRPIFKSIRRRQQNGVC